MFNRQVIVTVIYETVDRLASLVFFLFLDTLECAHRLRRRKTTGCVTEESGGDSNMPILAM